MCDAQIYRDMEEPKYNWKNTNEFESWEKLESFGDKILQKLVLSLHRGVRGSALD